ncbi:hypothetical protein TRFO_26394 [Tritrichomonas foetus]|uniref:Uncharacterized protein n=1 Tax=Tritrichomonas foetus TaxID=1144522 RepID=A0A1J4K4L7_9EUKA|nr:hypothetical protein TRFO_26394 [Tritrichomonas foetus]|eukprot:OHT05792.1 hypothetical protein TRFO_26394 [Tritrichomonas foetus]
MNIIDDFSDSTDSEDDEIRKIIKCDKDVPVEFSINSLLQTRKTDSTMNTPIRKIELSDDSSNDDEFKAPMKLPALPEREPSIFDFSQGSKTTRVFEILDAQPISDTPTFPKLSEWQYQTFLYLVDKIIPSNDIIFFSLVQEIIARKSCISGDSLLKFANKFPPHSIDYFHWFEMLRETMFSYKDAVPYLLAIADPEIFKYESEEEAEKAPFDIIVLHVAAILDPIISDNCKYGIALKKLKHILKSYTFPPDKMNNLIDSCFDLAEEEVSDITEISNIFSFISLFPLDGIGCEIVYQICLRLSLHLLGAEYLPDSLNMDLLANSMSQLKSLCNDSLKNNELRRASAAMALTEKTLVAAMKLKKVSKNNLMTFAKCMKFSINSSDPGVLTTLKEQIHVTRTQYESFIQANFL